MNYSHSTGYALLLTTLFLFFSLVTFTTIAQPSKPQVQLATIYQQKENIEHYWVSEKLDGIRGYWNGNSLLTRNGNVIYAPTWFTESWPNMPMDGELWIARNQFQQTSSCVLRKTPSRCWQNIQFMIFDLPKHAGTFSERIHTMQSITNQTTSKYLAMIPQVKFANEKALYTRLNQVVNNQGEGLMLHHQNGYYQRGRSQNIMKLKKHQDAEAIVVQHNNGKGKYYNMLGSLVVKTTEGLTFKIGSGFSDKERQNPPPIGSIITYKYFGKTNKGIPRFASFIRIRNPE